MAELEEIACAGGVFALPEGVYLDLQRAAPSGMVYLRHSEDTVVISPAAISGGRRRQLHHQYRSPTFQTATRLAVVVIGESVLLMATQWRPPRRNDQKDGSLKAGPK